MKAKELEELRKKDVDDLREMLDARRTEVMTLRFSHATGALENSAKLGRARRDVARILTIIDERSSNKSGTTA